IAGERAYLADFGRHEHLRLAAGERRAPDPRGAGLGDVERVVDHGERDRAIEPGDQRPLGAVGEADLGDLPRAVLGDSGTGMVSPFTISRGSLPPVGSTSNTRLAWKHSVMNSRPVLRLNWMPLGAVRPRAITVFMPAASIR